MNTFEHYLDIPVSACCCIGPQNGQPVCPCKMRGVIIKEGRYVMPEKDLGEVTVDWPDRHNGGKC